jgi:hypothetical protein
MFHEFLKCELLYISCYSMKWQLYFINILHFTCQILKVQIILLDIIWSTLSTLILEVEPQGRVFGYFSSFFPQFL